MRTEPQPEKAPRSPWHLATLILVLGACFAFLAIFGWKNAAQLPDLAWTAGTTWVSLAGAFAILLAGALLSAVNWRLLLRGLGQLPFRWSAEAVFLSTQVAKYLPGNVGHFIGRVALARARGFGGAAVATAVVVEQALAVATGILILAAGFLLAPDALGPLRAYLPPAPLLGATLLLALASPWILLAASRGLGFAFLPRLNQALSALRALPLPGLLAFLALQGGVFLLAGWALPCLAAATGTSLGYLPGTVIFAAAWTLGYLSPGAPGGLGVRETVLTLALTPLTGPGPALAVALLLRVVTVAVDVAAFIIGWFLGRCGLEQSAATRES